MRRMVMAWCIAGSLALVGPGWASGASAQTKAATAQCKDGTFSSAKTRRGACTGHGGVAKWLADTAKGPAATKPAPSKGSKSAGTAGRTEPANPAPKVPASHSPNAKTPGTDVPTNAGKGATGQCKDGSYTQARSKRGACSGHGGVVTWYADAAHGANAPNSPASTPAPKPDAFPSQPKDNAGPVKNSSSPTALCNDGTYSYAKHHQGACSGHKGVKSWLK